MRNYYRETQKMCNDFLYVQVFKTFTKAKKRRSRAKPTSEAQELLNEKHKHLKLEQLIHRNFTRSDMALHLTYAEGCEPQDANRAKKDIQNFFKKLKRRYLAIGKELKYIWVCECGKKSGHIHFHCIISEGLKRDDIEQLWGFGYANTKRLQFTENGVAGLSCYMTKSPLLFKSWSASRNLQKPEEKQDDYKYSQRAVKDIAESERYSEFMKNYPGYGVSDFEIINNGNNGGIYIYARLFKESAFIRAPFERRNS